MTDFHDKPYHSRSDLVGNPNKPQEGSHKTSFAFVSDLGAGKHPSPLEKKKKILKNFKKKKKKKNFKKLKKKIKKKKKKIVLIIT